MGTPQVGGPRLLMIVRFLQLLSGARHPARNPVPGSTISAPGDPAGNARRPHPARPAARSHANVTMPRADPAPHGAARPPGRQWQPAFRIPAALRSEWQAGTARLVRFMPPGGSHGHHGRSRTPHAECSPAGIFSTVSPALPAPRSGGWPHHAASPSPRPPPEAPAPERRPRREKAGPGGHSAPPAIPYSFPYTCRHRNPPNPGNAQAVPGINLRVNSQTYIRAQLVKQS